MNKASEVMELVGADCIELTVNVVAAYLTRNHVPATELPALLTSVHAAFAGVGQGPVSSEPEIEKPTAKQIRKSIRPDALISFEDGKPYKVLKRHLAALGLTHEEYCAKWGLPRDYPTTALRFSEQRSKHARSHGLSQRRKTATPKLTLVVETAAGPFEHDGVAAPSVKSAKSRKPRVAAAK